MNDGSPPPALNRAEPAAGLSGPPFEIRRPTGARAALVVASPHSGRDYPADFVRSSALDPLALRKSEDSFVDELFACAPNEGAPMLTARFPRAYVDVNREPYELDPTMFADALPDYVNTTSPRVAAGLGTIARIVANGESIYREKLPFAEAKRRSEAYYSPYHDALAGLIDETVAAFGRCVLIDAHSMPTHGIGPRGADVVLGDLHGAACAPALTEAAERFLRGRSYHVVRNAPYAGGYVTRHYGRPRNGVHVLQVELARAMYMDERRLTRRSCFASVAADCSGLLAAVRAVPAARLEPGAGA